MYYVSRVSLSDMHNSVGTKSYDLNLSPEGKVTYFFGPNGCGKSTILQAIQLALLGYIPGTNKRVSDIFKHSNSGKLMQVSVELIDEATQEKVNITRTWLGGKTITSQLTTDPDGIDPITLVGSLELPVFNFDTFIGQSANALKDWFIKFLPSQVLNIDWTDKLTRECPWELSDVIADIVAHIDGDTVIDQCTSANKYIKEMKSATNSKITMLEDTLKGIVLYEDIPFGATEDSIKAEINRLDAAIAKWESAEAFFTIQKHNDEIQEKLNALPEAADVEALQKECADLVAKSQEWDKTIHDYSSRIVQLQEERINILVRKDKVSDVVAGAGVCPYTDTPCNAIKQITEDARKEYADLQQGLIDVDAEIAHNKEGVATLTTKVNNVFDQIKYIDEKIKDEQHNQVLREQLIGSLLPVPEQITMDADELLGDVEMLKTQKAQALDTLAHIGVNQSSRALRDKLTKEIATAKQVLDAVKLWDKLTGPNGLPDEFTRATFEHAAHEITRYMDDLVGSNFDVEFEFGDTGGAQGFTFGACVNYSYVPYDMLSSGQRTILMIALLSYIADHSDSEVKTILVDDAFDHLDAVNIEATFNMMCELSRTKGIQFIVAAASKPDVSDGPEIRNLL